MQINLLDFPVYYINLERDTEKNAHMQTMLRDLGFKDVTRVEGVIDSEASWVGVAKSHLKLLQIAGGTPFLFFEDDCDIHQFTPVISVPDDADAVYLGNTVYARKNGHTGRFLKYRKHPDFPNMYRVYNMLASHAVLFVSGDYHRMCMRTAYHSAYVSKTACDIGYAEIQKWFRVYTPLDPLFYQKHYGTSRTTMEPFTNRRLTDYETSQDMDAYAHHLETEDEYDV